MIINVNAPRIQTANSNIQTLKLGRIHFTNFQTVNVGTEAFSCMQCLGDTNKQG